MEVSVKIDGLDGMIKNFVNAKPIIQETLREAMQRSTERVRNSAKIKSPINTGALRGSIVDSVEIRGDELVGLVTADKNYAPYMETGTRPHFPPPQALEGWAKSHGINAFVLARAISKKGVKAHPFMVPAFEENKALIVKIFEQAMTYIANKLTN